MLMKWLSLPQRETDQPVRIILDIGALPGNDENPRYGAFIRG